MAINYKIILNHVNMWVKFRILGYWCPEKADSVIIIVSYKVIAQVSQQKMFYVMISINHISFSIYTRFVSIDNKDYFTFSCEKDG